MKKILLFFIVCLSTTDLFAQKETFDLFAFTLPAGWKKEVTENIISYTKTNNKNKSWCRIGIVKSTISKGNIEADFESEWQDLIVKNYNPTEAPVLNEARETDGWKVKDGVVKFTFNNSVAQAMLTTISGFDRCASIVITLNNQEYINDIDSFLQSVEFKKMEPATQPPVTGIGSDTDSKTSKNTKTKPAQQTAVKTFTFSTTNFDDGWVATEQDDWVQVTNGNIKVLIHYPNKQADAYNSVLMDGLKNAWNLLIAPRYSSGANFEFKPISGWQSIEFAEADAVEKATGKSVHVVLFKMNYSNGSGKYMEFITPDKRTYEQEFGPYHQESYGWEKVEAIANYNKFAVAASDLSGKWTSDFSGAIQYVNAYTGFDAGMDTHASNENFQFGSANQYNWDLGVASGAVGNIKFQSVKSSGHFSMAGNWQITFSDIEGKARTYNTYFSCIKGLRILWLDDRPFAKSQ
jgi:hypothetical protein